MRRSSIAFVYVLVSLSCTFLTIPASGQGFGVVGGANFTSIDNVNYGSATATFENRTGYHVGAYLRLGLGPIDVRPGLRYLNAGPIFEGLSSAVNQTPGGESLYDSFDVSFVSVPLDVAINVTGPLISPYVFAGPEFRFQQAPDVPEVLEDELNDWSYIGNIGLGVKVNLPGAGLTLTPEIRYSFGLSDLIDKEFTYGNQTFTAVDQRRSDSFFISLGIEP